jgi:hypothetical protein
MMKAETRLINCRCLQKTPREKEAPGTHSLEELNMKIERACWTRKILKLAKESWQAFSLSSNGKSFTPGESGSLP